MAARVRALLLLVALCVNSVWMDDEFTACVIQLGCEECIPDDMPLVTSHSAVGGAVRVAQGARVTLSCGGARFLAYPMRVTLEAVCEAGRYRVLHDRTLRHLLELGCQESIFEDVLHQVSHCGAPLQGRAYRSSGSAVGGGTAHYVTLCYEQERAVPLSARMTSASDNRLPMTAHDDRHAPLTLLGNFNHMFDSRSRRDAERLFSDDAATDRRLRELLKHGHHCFADQKLTSAKLLSGDYFEDQNMRVTNFVSNKIAVWKSVAEGNLRNLQRDVSEAIRRARPALVLEVYAGTHGVMTLRSDPDPVPLYLKAERRFPVPEYVWTVVHDPAGHRAVALVTLNDPFVAVSEIRESVFCESACGQIAWLKELRRNHNYETPLYGLVFCCSVHNFTAVVHEMPTEPLRGISVDNGLLTNL